MKQPDILIFMSDQHSPEFSGWGNTPVDTPVLDRLKKSGTSFEAAYTASPLCVPARMAMMSSLLPSRTGIFTNQDTLPDLTPCFTHALVEAGYETVLIGRMHFLGKDQHHGFTRRLAGDITPVTWNPPVEAIQREFGPLSLCARESNCMDIIGAGESQVIQFDRMVIKTALGYLKEKHQKPQFILVGTYGPHFPYVAEKELYLKYLKRAKKPAGFDPGTAPDYLNGLDVLNRRIKGPDITWEMGKGALAAYCAQIEQMDRQIGQIQEAFSNFVNKRNTSSIFGYLSDHGDMVGERRMYGKQTYFEKSARIPMIFTGNGILSGKSYLHPVSILDFGPTICSLAGTDFSIGDGISLAGILKGSESGNEDRIVASQFVEIYHGISHASIMLRYRNFKYILYHRYESHALLFDLEADPGETHNLAGELPDLAHWFFMQCRKTGDFEHMERDLESHTRNFKWFQAFESAVGADDSLRWKGNLQIKTLEAVEEHIGIMNE